jgi:16S rRNA (guanine527-N7)-methyltransferase
MEKSNKQKFAQLLQLELNKIGVSLNARQAEKFDLLGESMLADPLYKSVSKIFEPSEIVMKHFLDSLVPLAFSLPCWENSKLILDLGTGGGFPMLPLAIMMPEARFIGVDSRLKSVEFVGRMANGTGLNNVSAKHSRIEELGRDKKFREKADLVICRALSAVRTLFEYCVPLVKNKGYALFYKGPKLEIELKESESAMKELGISKQQVILKELQEEVFGFSRGYLLVNKLKSVPDLYPRKSGMPTAKPL